MNVDVIIPNHNYARFLPEAVASAFAQTRPAATVTVIDDGSTEAATDDVLADLEHCYPGLRVVRQDNRGVVPTFRRGIAETQSPAFVTLSADDRLDPRYIELTTTLLSAHPEAGYCYTDMLEFGARDGLKRAGPFSAPRLACRGNYIGGGALIRRTAYVATRGFADLPYYEDWDLWLSFLDAGWVGVWCPEPLYHWRQHGPSRNQMSRRERFLIKRRIQARHARSYARYLPAAVVTEGPQWVRSRIARS